MQEPLIMSPEDGLIYSLDRARKSEDTICATGQVLRDYVTDLFPMLEVGASSKVLSITPLLAGGTIYEAGAGGTAPMLFQKFLKDNHSLWDPIGEFLALAESLEDNAKRSSNTGAHVLAQALRSANAKYLEVDEDATYPAYARYLKNKEKIDTRTSQFFLAMFWAKALAEQDKDKPLKDRFADLYKQLTDKEEDIITEFNAALGTPVDIGGYWHPNQRKVEEAMRPSKTFNAILDSFLVAAPEPLGAAGVVPSSGAAALHDLMAVIVSSAIFPLLSAAIFSW